MVTRQDVKENRFADQIRQLTQEKSVNEEKLALTKKHIMTLEARLKNSEEETNLRTEIDSLDKQQYEMDLESRRQKENEARFHDLQKSINKQIAIADAEINKYSREMEEIDKESIPQVNRELEEKREARRNVEREIKALKEGKDNTQNQMQAMEKEIQDASYREGQAKNKL